MNQISARQRLFRRVVIIAGIVSVLVLAVTLSIFQPWLLAVDARVDEAVPSDGVTVASGQLISHAHSTSGEVAVVSRPDGSQFVTLTNLSTSLGPDVHIWLSAAHVSTDGTNSAAAGGADYIDLGALKGDSGNQTYEIPAGVDASAYSSVWLWCVSFSVSFGAAELSG